jgi:hypothetical protein
MTRVHLFGSALASLIATAVFGSACGGSVAGVGNVAGDRCSMPGILQCGTSADGKGMGVVLSCPLMSGVGFGSWQAVFHCPPAQPCNEEVGSTSITCGPSGDPLNNAYAIEGTSCAADGNAACTFDATAVLNCMAGTWILGEMCVNGPCQSLAPGGSTPSETCPSYATTGCTVCGG